VDARHEEVGARIASTLVVVVAVASLGRRATVSVCELPSVLPSPCETYGPTGCRVRPEKRCGCADLRARGEGSDSGRARSHGAHLRVTSANGPVYRH
jgi:hypothetical protein